MIVPGIICGGMTSLMLVSLVINKFLSLEHYDDLLFLASSASHVFKTAVKTAYSQSVW